MRLKSLTIKDSIAKPKKSKLSVPSKAFLRQLKKRIRPMLIGIYKKNLNNHCPSCPWKTTSSQLNLFRMRSHLLKDSAAEVISSKAKGWALKVDQSSTNTTTCPTFIKSCNISLPKLLLRFSTVTEETFLSVCNKLKSFKDSLSVVSTQKLIRRLFIRNSERLPKLSNQKLLPVSFLK